ncbi:hypothetical protein CC78DRAFT_584573 [Lojkania enalia]|uniref:Uncharacterized protein n=1 Tax=Lojkania enalia TaxID=147567 RepID=A0A9P4N0N3_9PLEO|nr:hypothetical protein CC78DRAFT_584573 [Didymosphaeria enalia]
MRFNILTLASIPLVAMPVAQAFVTLALFQDNDCQTPIPGAGTTTVNSGSCDTNVDVGWSSAMVIDNTDSPAGTLTFFERNNCAVAQPSKGFSSANFACLNNFGFVANAAGLVG